LLLAKAKPQTNLFRSLTLADLVLIVGAAIIVIPTMFQVGQFNWTTEQGGHGPIVLATGVWLLWREITTSPAERRPGNALVGALLLAAMLGVYVLARVTGILEIEALAMYGALITGCYLLFGGRLIRSIWFPLLYLALALPPPDSVVAAITQPIKIAISQWAVSLLYAVGYPIASSGVTIQIAQYELLVAAACAGLNSIISLGAICLFLRLPSAPDELRRLRGHRLVGDPDRCVLELHPGSDLDPHHLLYGRVRSAGLPPRLRRTDDVRGRAVDRFRDRQPVHEAPSSPDGASRAMTGAERTGQMLTRRKFALGIAFAGAAGVAAARQPSVRVDYLGKDKLEKVVPDKIGRWTYVSSSGLVVPPEDQLSRALYSQLLTRVYAGDDGSTMMVLVAQSGSQTGILQIHRPEICYNAGGYALSDVQPHTVHLPSGAIPTMSMAATNGARTEQLVYWTRIGNHMPTSWRQQRFAVAIDNLKGRIPDAVMVRVSTISNNRDAALQSIDEFVRAMLDPMAPNVRRVFIA